MCETCDKTTRRLVNSPDACELTWVCPTCGQTNTFKKEARREPWQWPEWNWEDAAFFFVIFCVLIVPILAAVAVTVIKADRD